MVFFTFSIKKSVILILVSLVTHSKAKMIIWIVEDSGELTKAWPKYAVNKMFQTDGYQSCWAETLHQG